VDERALAWVDADQQRLTQAVLQLAANAVRHTDDGAEIAIGSRLTGQTALLWVRDTGEGIDVEQQARLFERFRRGTDQGEGSGLGLAIVRGIAQAHGGSVRLESALGAGATFTISFPTYGESMRSSR
jgi:signal transduction histidine kinase